MREIWQMLDQRVTEPCIRQCLSVLSEIGVYHIWWFTIFPLQKWVGIWMYPVYNLLVAVHVLLSKLHLTCYYCNLKYVIYLFISSVISSYRSRCYGIFLYLSLKNFICLWRTFYDRKHRPSNYLKYYDLIMFSTFYFLTRMCFISVVTDGLARLTYGCICITI